MRLRLTFEVDIHEVPDTDESATEFGGSLGARLAKENWPAPVTYFRLAGIERERTYFADVPLAGEAPAWAKLVQS